MRATQVAQTVQRTLAQCQAAQATRAAPRVGRQLGTPQRGVRHSSLQGARGGASLPSLVGHGHRAPVRAVSAWAWVESAGSPWDGDEGGEAGEAGGLLEGWEGMEAPAGEQSLDSGLYLVGTPIGNLEDITLRAIRVLRTADAILAEDTRRTGLLLQHLGIKAKLMSFHAHNEVARRESVLQQLQAGAALALVSDAGMPGVSDPGSDLVAAASEAGVNIVPIPGPSAVLAGLVASGLPTDAFLFGGFLPKQSKARKARIQELAGGQWTIVFYVPPHGLISVLEDASEVLGGERRCVVARELTKRYEEFWRSTLSEAAAEFEGRGVKGEVTLLIEGAGPAGDGEEVTDDEIRSRLKQLLGEGVRVSEASKIIAAETSAKRKDVYNIALAMTGGKEKR